MGTKWGYSRRNRKGSLSLFALVLTECFGQNSLIKEISILHFIFVLQAIAEYSPSRGARPGLAQPLALIFTDGFGMLDFGAEANQLRRTLSNQVYAIAVDNDAKMPTAREELIRISGDPKRVFTERNLDELFGKQLRDLLRGC
jgi:hypothetical protein